MTSTAYTSYGFVRFYRFFYVFIFFKKNQECYYLKYIKNITIVKY